MPPLYDSSETPLSMRGAWALGQHQCPPAPPPAETHQATRWKGPGHLPNQNDGGMGNAGWAEGMLRSSRGRAANTREGGGYISSPGS